MRHSHLERLIYYTSVTHACDSTCHAIMSWSEGIQFNFSKHTEYVSYTNCRHRDSSPEAIAQPIKALPGRLWRHIGPFYYRWITPLWMISNHTPNKMWYEITWTYTNFVGGTVRVWKWISNFTSHFILDVITSHAGISIKSYKQKDSNHRRLN